MPSKHRRFYFVAAIIWVGMIFLAISIYLDFTFGYLSNASWNRMLSCPDPNSPFPSSPKSTGDTIFSGQSLSCHPAFAVSHYMTRLRRSTDLDFAPIFSGIILIIAMSFFIPPLIRSKYRDDEYSFILQLSFGVLGITSLAIFLIIGFALSEDRNGTVQLVNELDWTFIHTNPGQVLEDPRCAMMDNISRKGVCLSEEAWHVITLQCVLNGEGAFTQIGGGEEMLPSVVTRNKAWKTQALTFAGSQIQYTYKHLQLLGFCPWVEYRGIAAMLILVTICIFCGVCLMSCCLNSTSTVNPESPEPKSPNTSADHSKSDIVQTESELQQKLQKSSRISFQSRITDFEDTLTINSLQFVGRKNTESQWKLDPRNEIVSSTPTVTQIFPHPPQKKGMSHPGHSKQEVQPKNWPINDDDTATLADLVITPTDPTHSVNPTRKKAPQKKQQSTTTPADTIPTSHLKRRQTRKMDENLPKE